METRTWFTGAGGDGQPTDVFGGRRAVRESPLAKLVSGETDVPISGDDIVAFLDGEVNLLMHSDLRDGMTPRDLVGKHNAMVLLYHDDRDVGHWVCGWLDGDTYNHFDAYGEPPLRGVYADIVGQCRWNDVPYQMPRKSTCGRHAMVRLGLRRFSDEEYRASLPPGKADHMVTLMTLQTSLNQIP